MDVARRVWHGSRRVWRDTCMHACELAHANHHQGGRTLCARRQTADGDSKRNAAHNDRVGEEDGRRPIHRAEKLAEKLAWLRLRAEYAVARGGRGEGGPSTRRRRVSSKHDPRALCTPRTCSLETQEWDASSQPERTPDQGQRPLCTLRRTPFRSTCNRTRIPARGARAQTNAGAQTGSQSDTGPTLSMHLPRYSHGLQQSAAIARALRRR